MKKNLIAIFLFCFTIICNAQSYNTKRADNYFARAYYAEAIPLYKSFLEDFTSYNALHKLADSYYYTNNMSKANRYYKYLMTYYKRKLTDDVYLKYSETLKAINKPEKANALLKEFYKSKKDKKALELLDAKNAYLSNITEIGERYKIENLAINTENSEFGAIPYKGKLVFSATKKENSLFKKLYKWNNTPYLNIYEIPLSDINAKEKSYNSISDNINTKVHEANAVFTKDGKTVYFTRNNFTNNTRKRDSLKITHLQIFKAELKEGKWTNVQSLPFNSNTYSTEHPALSADEKTLYFASDMPGGFGSFDIYSIAILKQGKYGEATNLGATINTSKKEQFPFISKKNELYFSSNGHPGFGSLDVFVSKISKNNYSKPDNVGLPINSSYDDFSFNIDTKTKVGYFASNRLSGKGSDDIYKVSEIKPLIIEDCKQVIAVTITDADTKQGLYNANLLINKGTAESSSLKTNAKGKLNYNTKCTATYTLVASKKGYQQQEKKVIIDATRGKNNKVAIALKAIKQEKKERKTIRRDRITRKPVPVKKDIIIVNNNKTSVETRGVNFDYKLWYLRKDAKLEVDKVIAVMKNNPAIVIEVATHSDIRGPQKYNLELSQKRANSVRDYIIENGISRNRVTAIGYGESKPIKKCATEDACTEEEHELNRRCEFIIKK